MEFWCEDICSLFCIVDWNIHCKKGFQIWQNVPKILGSLQHLEEAISMVLEDFGFFRALAFCILWNSNNVGVGFKDWLNIDIC